MKLWFALLLALAPGFALAGDCDDAVSTPDIDECAAQELERAEVELNAAYKKVLAGLQGMGHEMPDALEARHHARQRTKELQRYMQ